MYGVLLIDASVTYRPLSTGRCRPIGPGQQNTLNLPILPIDPIFMAVLHKNCTFATVNKRTANDVSDIEGVINLLCLKRR